MVNVITYIGSIFNRKIDMLVFHEYGFKSYLNSIHLGVEIVGGDLC